MPGDGQHVIWSVLVGHSRARYFLLTGKKLARREALEWGAVDGVLRLDQVLDRAWSSRAELVKRPPLTLRYTRQPFTHPLTAHSWTTSATASRVNVRATSILRSAAAWSRSTERGTAVRGRASPTPHEG